MDREIQDLIEQLYREISKYNKNYNGELLNNAFLFAKKAHEGVLSLDKKPHIIHSIKTALHLTKIEADDISIAGALLHEVLQNDKITASIVAENFGKTISGIVLGVSKLGNISYSIGMLSEDIERLRKDIISVGDDIRIFLVKVADRYHTLESLEYLPPKERYRIAKETEEIYLPIVNFLSIGEFLTDMHDLCFKYTDYREYQKLYKIFGKKRSKNEKIIIDANNRLEKIFTKEHLDIVQVSGRVKSLYSIHKKIVSKNIDFDKIYDVLALRITTKDIKDAYITLGIIHSIYTMKENRFKDYISNPKKNGYQAIHTTVYDESGEFLEFQIQTKDMSILNKSGLARHFIYKGFGVEVHTMPTWMKGVIDLQKNTINTKAFFKKLREEITISEIRIFSPRGEMKLLPRDRTLIDYAFVYSNTSGKYFDSALVNGVQVLDPFYILKDGDIIQIIKSRDVFLNYDVGSLELLKTGYSKDKITQIISKYSKPKSIEYGRYILDTLLENLGYKHISSYPEKIVQLVLQNFKSKDLDSLYYNIAISKLSPDEITNYLMEILDVDKFDKSILLRISLKVNNFTSINNIIDIFYNLGYPLNKIRYNENKNKIILGFQIDTKQNLQELLRELKRAPNILDISRIFTLRLKLYYGIYVGAFMALLGILLFINIFDFSEYKKTLLLDISIISLNIFMFSLYLVIRYLVKNILPDITRYKRFWLSLFSLNTFMFVIVIYEIYRLGFNYYYILFFISIILLYILGFYEFYHKKKII